LASGQKYGSPHLALGIPKSRKSNSWSQTTAQSRSAHPGIPDRGRGERLIEAAKDNRYGHRDATMIFVAYRHGLRAAELVDLRWDQIEFRTATLHVRRVKQGSPSTHPILGDELRALRRLQREQESKSPFVFTSERGAPFTPAGFARMIERVGAAAKLGFKAHPHMLRHACGYKLANDGHDTRALQAYLGHKNIQHTVRYTELTPTRFKDFWRK
jgi:type 1 fimbriae regulatory protein FimB/type 1 fimbriae regulatory protein FimE